MGGSILLFPTVPWSTAYGVVVYLCVETCPVVSAHTKGAHIWPLYRLQHTKTTTSGSFMERQNIPGCWSSLWDWHLKHVAHCRKLSSTSSFWQLSPYKCSHHTLSQSIDGRRFGDPWVDSMTQRLHITAKHHIQKLLAFTSSITYNSFPHRQIQLISLAFFVGPNSAHH